MTQQPGWTGANASKNNCAICDDSTKERRWFHLTGSNGITGKNGVINHLTLCITCAAAGVLGESWHGCGCGG